MSDGPSNDGIIWECLSCGISYPMGPIDWIWTGHRYLKYCRRCSEKDRLSRNPLQTALQTADSLDDEWQWVSKISTGIYRRHIVRWPSVPMITPLELYSQHRDQRGKCFYTGLEYKIGERLDNPLAATVERKDNEKGYESENVVICCWFVNAAKGKWPIELMMKLWAHLPTQ